MPRRRRRRRRRRRVYNNHSVSVPSLCKEIKMGHGMPQSI
jgi:hypothetical protein